MEPRGGLEPTNQVRLGATVGLMAEAVPAVTVAEI